MTKFPEHPQFNEATEKPKDRLPDGMDKEDYLRKDKEWRNLDKRLGQPRILNNVYFPEVLNWIQKKYKNNPDDLSYFEAGCGHGNDLRAIRNKLGGQGRFLGVDMSTAEIRRGLEFYRPQEDTAEAKRLFAQGDLRDLKHIYTWDKEKGEFSQPVEIKDGEFALIYTEAVLHGLGHGKKTYQEKKESAQQMLNELFRICQAGGKFFGRATTFDQTLTKEQQHELMRQADDWRFIPEAQEFKEMLEQARFKNIKIDLKKNEMAKKRPHRKDTLRFSFLAEKLS